MHAQFGARQNVNQTRKMGVLPAQKRSGDALRAYLSGRDVGWYGCTSSARSAIHLPPWFHPVAQPGAPDVYPSGAVRYTDIFHRFFGKKHRYLWLQLYAAADTACVSGWLRCLV